MLRHALPLLAGTAFAAYTVDRARRQRAERRLVCSESWNVDTCAANHSAKVGRIARQLQERDTTTPVSIRKRAVAHQVPKAGDKRLADEKVDISDLNAIIDIDVENRVCTAEPGVTFVDLVAATLRHGLVPIIVPELKTITIGGAVSGCSIESMSFKYGGFHDTCLEYEVVTANGDVLVCTPDNENQLIFQMMHGSFGTLGILTQLKFRLIPAKPYVKVSYEKYKNLEDYKKAIWGHFQDQDIDFMDGIIHSPSEWVLSVGYFVDTAPYTSRYDWTRVYYKSTSTRSEDYFELPDYYFRYDRGVTNVFPKSFLGRLLLGRWVSSNQLLWLAERCNRLLNKHKPTIILDTFIPFSRLESFMTWYTEEFRHFPLWCVPYKRVRDYEWISDEFFASLDDELFVDIAIYGMKQDGKKNYHKIMEDKLLEIGGIKTLISHNYYSENDFWKSWNRKNFEAAKARTDPDNIFRDLYTKTCRVAMGIGEGSDDSDSTLRSP